MWHYSVKFKNCLLYYFDLLELIALHDNIPNNCSWAIGKSEQSKQAINILTLWWPLPSRQRSWKWKGKLQNRWWKKTSYLQVAPYIFDTNKLILLIFYLIPITLNDWYSKLATFYLLYYTCHLLLAIFYLPSVICFLLLAICLFLFETCSYFRLFLAFFRQHAASIYGFVR